VNYTHYYHTFSLGGFNNIRLGLEQVVLAAIVTGRTLVLPPKTGWYLIDWGPIQRDNKIGGKSRFHDFWDVPDLKKWLPVLEAEEFAAKVREAHERMDTGEGVDILKQMVSPKPDVERRNGANNADQDSSPWNRWLRSIAQCGGHRQPGGPTTCADWNPLSHIVTWGAKSAAESEKIASPIDPAKDWKGEESAQSFVAYRKTMQYTLELQNAPLLHFPMTNDQKYRFLGQVAGFVAFPDGGEQCHQCRVWHRLMRTALHFRPDIFETAARVVAKLGLFQ
jgi:hypothetical protein